MNSHRLQKADPSFTTDLDSLIDFSPNIIIAGDLNVKLQS